MTDRHGKALLDRAIGELMRMHARLGHANRLEELFDELGLRPAVAAFTALTAANGYLMQLFYGRICCKQLLGFWYGDTVSRTRPAPFRGRHFADVILILCVRWYLRYSLSYRDLEEIMAELGRGSRHDPALGPTLCTPFESAASSGTPPSESFLEGGGDIR